MNLYVPIGYLKSLRKDKDDEAFRDVIRYHNDEEIVSIDSERFTDVQIEALRARATAGRIKDEKGSLSLIQKLTSLAKLEADPSGTPLNRLEALVTAAKRYMSKSPHKWLFADNDDGFMLPYFVKKIVYSPASRQSEAHVFFDLEAVCRNEAAGNTLSFYRRDLKGLTVPELLKAEGYYLENKDLVEAYEKEIERYKTLALKTGEQFLASGFGVVSRGSWHRTSTSMEREGVKTKVVIDNESDEDDDGRSRRNKGDVSLSSDAFWSVQKADPDSDDDNSEATDSVAVPVHPYVQVFDLDKHQFVEIHTNNLTEYEYDPTLVHKLVLSEAKKSLINILIAGSSEQMDDIVKGKMRGVIVLATGAPGTGKTLTAEVFSEEIKRPLYIVQCSQLGTNEESLEKELHLVLNRASRWKAILLIDEADVYIHERGSDIQQNAIVGVFLRVLEYYKGVLFMTSNKATIIDDAILSRATAWIKYDKPNKDELIKMWNILADNYQVNLGDADVAEIVKTLPRISGRSVRNLLKLAKLLAKKQNKVVNADLLKYVAQFQALDVEEEKE